MASLDLGTAEADGVSLAACAGATLSPLAISVEYDPWSTGSNLYGVLGGSLQIAGEADGEATTSGAPHYPVEGLQAEADGAAAGAAAPFVLARLNIIGATAGISQTNGILAGTLEIAGEADGAAAGDATQTGGGIPTPLNASAPSGSLPAATIRAANAIAPSGADGTAAASATIGVGTGRASAAGYTAPAAQLSLAAAMQAASGGTSATSANLQNQSTPIGTAAAAGRTATAGTIILLAALQTTQGGDSAPEGKLTDDPIAGGEADGASGPAAAITVYASISGRSGPDGWQAPPIAGAAQGAGSARGELSRNGAPTVQLAGSA